MSFHIALITPWHRKGGIATYSERFIAALANRDVTILPIPIPETNSANPFRFTDIIDRVPTDADAIHIQFEAGLFGRFGMSGIGAPAFFKALASEERPVVTTLHEVHRVHSHRGICGDLLLQTRDTMIERLALRASDTTIVHTREAESVLRNRHGSNWRIERILHPAATDPKPMEQEEAKEEIGIDGPIVLTFGWVERKKNYNEVVSLLPNYPEVTYLIAGGLREGEGESILESVRQLSAELGVSDRVKYWGYADASEVPALFSAADAVVLPYQRVSQSGAINDALAYRRPVLAPSLPAFEEIHDRFDCILTYDCQAELHDGLQRTLEDESVSSELERNAERYLLEVSWERFAERTEDIYSTLVNC